MLRNRLDTSEGTVEARSAAIVAGEIADVIDASVACRFRHSVVVAEEDDLNGRTKRTPTLDGVSLDVANVTLKRLRDCEQSQHRGRQ